MHGISYPGEDAIQVGVDVHIEAANDGPSALFEIRCPAGVVSALGLGTVRIAVDFDDEFDLGRGKIREERPHRMLPPKLGTFHLPHAQS